MWKPPPTGRASATPPPSATPVRRASSLAHHRRERDEVEAFLLAWAQRLERPLGAWSRPLPHTGASPAPTSTRTGHELFSTTAGTAEARLAPPRHVG